MSSSDIELAADHSRFPSRRRIRPRTRHGQSLRSAQTPADAFGKIATLDAARSGSHLKDIVLGMNFADLTVGLVGSCSIGVFHGASSTGQNPPLAAQLAVAPLWVAMLHASNAYDPRHLAHGADDRHAVERAALLLITLLALIGIPLEASTNLSTTVLVATLLLLGSVIVRRAGRHLLAQRRRGGHLLQRAVVAGQPEAAAALVRSLRADPHQGLQPVAICTTGYGGPEAVPTMIEGLPVVGGPENAVAILGMWNAEVVAVTACPELAGETLRRLAWTLHDRGAELLIAPGVVDVASARLSIRDSPLHSLLHVDRPGAKRRSVIGKAVVDRALALVLLSFLSPILIAIACVVRASDGGPAIYRQRRVGIRGDEFDIIKFRTMEVGAEKRLASLVDQNDGNEILFKLHNDPRVTKVGRILRTYSLDELPQLFNVVCGHMSLVGPRPSLPAEVAKYRKDEMRRLNVLPGMTGLWQVSGRSRLTWEESIRLDLRYVDNWSLGGDLRILYRTIGAVLRGQGAY